MAAKQILTWDLEKREPFSLKCQQKSPKVDSNWPTFHHLPAFQWIWVGVQEGGAESMIDISPQITRSGGGFPLQPERELQNMLRGEKYLLSQSLLLVG